MITLIITNDIFDNLKGNSALNKKKFIIYVLYPLSANYINLVFSQTLQIVPLVDDCLLLFSKKTSYPIKLIIKKIEN